MAEAAALLVDGVFSAQALRSMDTGRSIPSAANLVPEMQENKGPFGNLARYHT